MKAWTAQELLKILEQAKARSSRNHLIVLLAYKHGLRAIEVARLRVRDVQNGRLDCVRVKGSLHTNRPLESDSNVLLDEKLALAAWLRERGDDGSPFLFTSRISHKARTRLAATRTNTTRWEDDKEATGISRDAIAEIVEDAAFRAGIEPGRRHAHCAKHTLGYLAHRAGVDVFNLQQLLGHRDIKSTAVYAAATQDEAHAKAKGAMAAIFA
jgi:integrase